jgi:hypothetical protein
MKARTITATFKYCNSCTQEVKTVNCLFDDRAEKHELTKVYVVEFGCELIFSKLDNHFNHFLVND